MRLLPSGLKRVQPAGGADLWTPQRLQRLATRSGSAQLIVVSCREPYSHHHGVDGIEVISAASGVVTGLEPVVRACGGTWVAHGSGSADADCSDADGVCAVPPGNPEYALKRVWFSEAEKRGFLDGLANDSLWPLCHRCEVEPRFSAAHWRHYRAVNERFAQAVLAVAQGPDPLVLIQDYHFALLPALIRARLPGATVVSFWHIPWPSLDRLVACPWWSELVRGLMGSAIVGLQTTQDQAHFDAAVDACERRGLSQGDRGSPMVACYPISVPWPSKADRLALPSVASCRQDVLRALGLAPETRLIVGVDRFDYTKGLVEKVRAFERLLAAHPQWQGRVALVQVAAPTRASVPAYALHQRRVRQEVARVNRRWSARGAPAIVLLEAQHDRAAVCRLYRAAAVCAVTSLHDGMNLVSKEFVAVRDDEQGVLLLSAFAGAAEELGDAALVVDPRDTEALAQAMAQALAMPAAAQAERMARLRHTVRRSNVYRWAGEMLSDALWLRDRPPETAVAPWPAVA